jgi:thioredoxin-like negative regulator of GroEL
MSYERLRWPIRLLWPRLATACLAVLGLAAPLAAAAPAPLAEQLDRAERLQDWAAVQKLAARFVFERRADLYAVTSILDACVALGCDEEAAVRGLRGPLVSEGVKEFARAWIDYVARDPASARPRFEALARAPATAWLGAFGRIAYATDARNARLLREALKDAKADPAVATAIPEDIHTASMALAALENDDGLVLSLAKQGGDSAGALMARFGQEVAADDFAAARKTLQRYAARWGEDQDVVVGRVELARLQQPPEEVVALAQRALVQHPRFWKLRFPLARALLETGDEEAAHALFREGMPTMFAAVRLELAMLPGDFGEATRADLASYERQLAPYFDFPEAQAALAGAMLDAGHAEDASALLGRVDSMTDALPSSLNVRARMAREAGQPREYVAILERLAAQSPRDVDAQFLLALAYAGNGESVKAARIVAALRHSPRYVSPRNLDVLEKVLREAEPSFRTASLR